MKLGTLGICLVAALALAGCGGGKEEAKTFEKIDADQAMAKMSEDVVILDVRTKEEYAQGHIKDAVNLPLDKIDKIDSVVEDKEKTILVYCRSGNRSAQAAEALANDGYTQVFDFGGIQDWPYDIVK